MPPSPPILDVRHLKVHFPIKKGVFARTVGVVKAVDDVSFVLKRGETLGVVGESGCGKSTTSRAILGLVKPTAGEIFFDGTRVEELNKLDYHRRVQVVFQDPMASLNPRHTVRETLSEGMIWHGLCSKAEARARSAQLLTRVGLPESFLDRYPHEFSGGQRQRICIARAISLRPEVLICDEAVSALDLSIRAQVLDLLRDLKEKMGLSFLFITHDIGVVQHFADRILVMNRGRLVEEGTVDEVLKSPKEAYTRRLMAAVPRMRARNR